MRNTLYILLALVTLFLQKVSGEENSSYYFTHINGDNGLSSSNVKAIIQIATVLCGSERRMVSIVLTVLPSCG